MAGLLFLQLPCNSSFQQQHKCTVTIVVYLYICVSHHHCSLISIRLFKRKYVSQWSIVSPLQGGLFSLIPRCPADIARTETNNFPTSCFLSILTHSKGKDLCFGVPFFDYDTNLPQWNGFRNGFRIGMEKCWYSGAYLFGHDLYNRSGSIHSEKRC